MIVFEKKSKCRLFLFSRVTCHLWHHVLPLGESYALTLTYLYSYVRSWYQVGLWPFCGRITPSSLLLMRTGKKCQVATNANEQQMITRSSSSSVPGTQQQLLGRVIIIKLLITIRNYYQRYPRTQQSRLAKQVLVYIIRIYVYMCIYICTITMTRRREQAKGYQYQMSVSILFT